MGCGKSKIFASPVLFLLFLFFLLLFSVIILFLNEINDDDDDDFTWLCANQHFFRFNVKPESLMTLRNFSKSLKC